MTILFAGAELSDVEYINGAYFDTSVATARRTAFARGSFLSWGNDPNSNPNVGRVTFSKWSSPASVFWISFQYIGQIRPVNNGQVFTFKDSSGVVRLLIRGTGSTTYKVSKRNAAGTITDVGTFSAGDPLMPSLTKVDFYVDYSSTGSVSFYQNGIFRSTVSGDMLTDSATELRQFEAGGIGYYTSERVYISEVIVATTSTRSMSLATLTSSTAGAAQQWTGTATNVNKTGTAFDDTLYVYSATADQVQQYKPAAAPSGPFAVAAVVTSARALVGTTGPQKIAAVTRVGSTDYTSADYTPLTSFGPVQHIQETNPSTSSTWGLADLAPTNLQYGVKSRT